MIVVADSGPPHYLILIDQIDLLRRLYEQVVIPEAVAAELRAAGAPPAVSNWIAHPPAWAVITAVSPEETESISDELDFGERAAIALAATMRADLLLIDDAAGRREATRRNLRVMGTLGVLRLAAEKGIIGVRETLSKLSATSFYIDDELLSAIFGDWLGD